MQWELLNLLEGLLSTEPTERLTADDVLRHKWILENTKENCTWCCVGIEGRGGRKGCQRCGDNLNRFRIPVKLEPGACKVCVCKRNQCNRCKQNAIEEANQRVFK